MTRAVQERVSVVVCTYDAGRLHLLERALASVRRQTLTPLEVVVVNDGSAELAAALPRLVTDEVVVELPRNAGCSVARNAGAGIARGDWVAFLDDDAEADETWLEHLLTACLETGAVGAGGRSEPSFAVDRPAWLPEELLWTVGCTYAGLPARRHVVRNTFGGCCVLRRRVFEEVGGFDQGVGRRRDDTGGGEEAVLGVRLRRHDPSAHLLFEPSAVIHHHVPQGRTRPGYVLRRCSSEGRAKARLRRDWGTRAVLPEFEFAHRIPAAVVAALCQGRFSRAGVLVAAAAAAGAGFVVGSVELPRWSPRSGTRTEGAADGRVPLG